MKTVLFFVVAMATSISLAASSAGTYVVMSPSKLRPNSDFAVSVNILQASQDVSVTAFISQLSSNSPIASANGIFQAGRPGTLNMKIPGSLKKSQYRLTVEGTGGLMFSNSTKLGVVKKEFSLFIQTDKGIYKAGDTVNFRVFGMYSDLKAFVGPMDISIYDGDYNKIRQWLQVTPKDGVVTQKLQLSSQPPLGEWKISVEASNTKESAEKTFEVAEYVLPKFEVSVILPSYVLSSETDVTATIKAKYTYGKPVKGTADVQVKWERITNAISFPNVALDGETKVTFPMSKLNAIRSHFFSKKIIVLANVTEELTGNAMSGNATVTVYSNGVKLEFLDTNPKSFKPGLDYTALLKVSQPDGLPLNPGSEQIIVSTRFELATKRTNYINAPDVSVSVPDNGIIALPVTVPANARSVKLWAKLSGTEDILTLAKAESPSNSYIQLALKTASKIQAGDNIDLEVSSTQPLTQLVYQVLSRGQIVKTGLVTSQNKMVQPFVLTTDASMAPSARVVVYYVRADGEIITDSISFNVDGVFLNKVSVKVNTATTGPGESVEVTVDADPSSVAHLAAIDQSVLLLRSGNDVSVEDVLGELEAYDTIDKPSVSWWRRWIVQYYGGSDAKQVLENSGVKVLTDCLVYKKPAPKWSSSFVYFRKGFTGKGVLAKSAAFRSPVKAVISSPNPKTPTRIRSNFAESWLWSDMTLGASGSATTTAKIPDTITSWVVSAFATNQNTGLGVAPTQAKLTVFKPFFVSLNLPYSVTRGEEVAVQANVFNYLQQDVTVRVNLAESSDYQNIFIQPDGVETYGNAEVYQEVTIEAGEAKSVFFPIIPSVLGRIDLDVTAITSIAADRIVKQLLVEAEGIPKEYNVPVLIDLTDGKDKFNKTLELTLPGSVVSGSELVRVSAVGDLMGPTIEGLDALLRMPTGCGEQNMVKLAPDVYIVDYLKSVNQLSDDIEKKALNYMESGYQKELTYKHEDGSFSAFGSRDESGSMWLTAFVTKVFHQAKAHTFVDDQVLKRAIRWMITRQEPDGSFPEPGNVWSKTMQGQASGGVGLTCYVYISLLENKGLLTANDDLILDFQVQNGMAKALTYLEKEIALISDPYILAMASYAFQLAGSSKAQSVLNRLEAIAVKDGNMRYWHKAEAAKPKFGSWYSPRRTNAIDTEMTSYVLLAYSVKADIASGKEIMQWVSQQRNPNGGFTSTQDTVVALHAMSQYSKMTLGGNLNLQITAQLDSAPTYTFDIVKSNSLLTQTYETETVPTQVHINATGSGMALAEVAVFFNVESEVEDVTFDLTVNLIEETMNWLVVETCTRWLGQEDTSAMAVQEIGIPSGFSISGETITELPTLKRIEYQNKKVVLYLDEIGKTDVCLQFRAQRTNMVAKSQPAAIRVYDYYEPSNQVTEFYQSQILKETSVCEVCPECHTCV